MSARAPATVLAVLGFALASGAASAQSPAGIWLADSKTGCRVWDPAPEPEESVRWNGACRNGFADGTGVVEWYKAGSINETIEGTLRAGHLEGRALSHLANGTRVEGEYRNDLLEGLVVVTFPNGNKLMQQHRAGKPLGHFTLLYAGGERADGEVDEKGKMWGAETAPNGNRYEGEFRDYKATGKGTFVDASNGGTYKGDFVDGRWEGQGEIIFDNRDIYQGEFKGGKANGYGVFRKGADGRVFRGTWVDNCLLPANSENGLGATIGKTLAECGMR